MSLVVESAWTRSKGHATKALKERKSTGAVSAKLTVKWGVIGIDCWWSKCFIADRHEGLIDESTPPMSRPRATFISQAPKDNNPQPNSLFSAQVLLTPITKAMPDSTYYIDEDVGQDIEGQTGDESLPFKSLGFAVLTHGETHQFLTRKSLTGDVPEGSDASARLEWKPVAKAAMKKAVNYAKAQKKKAEKAQELEAQQAKVLADRTKVLEEAKKIVLEEDTSLPKAVRIKLDETDSQKVTPGDGKDIKGTRVRVFGRVHRERRQKENMFITLRDGYGFMQVILQGQLAKTYDALTLTRETSMEILGELRQVPEGAHAPNGRELHADYYKIHSGWKAAGGDDAITNRVSKDTEHATLLDLRHLTLRGETASKVLIVRDAVEWAFHVVYKELRM